MVNYPSKYIKNAIEEVSKLPGIGNRTAIRLVLYLLKAHEQQAYALGEALINLRKYTQYCEICNNISDHELCAICEDEKRDVQNICVVEDINELLAIERTNEYNGRFHVLGGLIDPLAGIGPNQLNIHKLIDRVQNEKINEVILALNSTPEGETTSYYIAKKLATFRIKISNIARGIPLGSNLEYADELTLIKSIRNRTLFQVSETIGEN